MKQSPKQPAKKRRAQLIKAAEKTFARKGYFGATTEEIARVAGLTKGALYYHFKSKEDVFFAVVKEHSNSHSQRILQYLEEETHPEVAIERVIRSSFKLIERQKYFAFEFWEQAHKIPRVRNYLSEEHKRLENRVVRYLVAHSFLKKRECESFIMLLRAVFDGVIVRQMFCHEKSDLSRLVKQVIEISKLYLKKNKLESD